MSRVLVWLLWMIWSPLANHSLFSCESHLIYVRTLKSHSNHSWVPPTYVILMSHKSTQLVSVQPAITTCPMTPHLKLMLLKLGLNFADHGCLHYLIWITKLTNIILIVKTQIRLTTGCTQNFSAHKHVWSFEPLVWLCHTLGYTYTWLTLPTKFAVICTLCTVYVCMYIHNNNYKCICMCYITIVRTLGNIR